jgi:hypothetical protein
VSLPARVTTLLIAFAAVVAGVVFVAAHFILSAPPVEDYTPYASGGQVNVVLQTDPQNTVTNKPDWVSYFIQNPQNKQWVHTTYFAVPAATKVNITRVTTAARHCATRSGARSPARSAAWST